MPPTQLAGALEARVDAGQIEAAELVDERPLGIAVVEHGAVSTSADVADDHKILISAAPLADIGRAQQVDARRCGAAATEPQDGGSRSRHRGCAEQRREREQVPALSLIHISEPTRPY